MRITISEGRKLQDDVPEPRAIRITEWAEDEQISGDFLRAAQAGQAMHGMSVDGDVLTIEADNVTLRYRVDLDLFATDMYDMKLIP